MGQYIDLGRRVEVIAGRPLGVRGRDHDPVAVKQQMVRAVDARDLVEVLGGEAAERAGPQAPNQNPRAVGRRKPGSEGDHAAVGVRFDVAQRPRLSGLDHRERAVGAVRDSGLRPGRESPGSRQHAAVAVEQHEVGVGPPVAVERTVRNRRTAVLGERLGTRSADRAEHAVDQPGDQDRTLVGLRLDDAPRPRLVVRQGYREHG